MSCCISAFYIALFPVLAAAGARSDQSPAPLFAGSSATDPDEAYRDRAHLPSARTALALWQQRLDANPSDFDAAWKIARAAYWLGTHGTEGERRAVLEGGVAAGRAALLMAGRPEGHFWMAGCMGALAESFGLRQGLRYRGNIKAALETVLRIDPAYQQGSADWAPEDLDFKAQAERRLRQMR